ncbi:hypothetical protein NA57DRAFT_63937 [Rhizodiscina lignyota]|uniref:Histone acetyltransferase ESA1 n=1 Tax=Rhizodiscina lignyota TaxID=1504668 RepID=A0A9P4MA70_9PEZI|nr:hypothetical protein NA57DRAFT_63937 [Rhizodiscina lignyota]
MAPRDKEDEASAEAEEPRVKGFATFDTLSVGVKAMVEKDGEYRKAEILAIQTRKGKPNYYVHYDEFNKRLDEWVKQERVDLSREVEWPLPEKPDKKKSGGQSGNKATSKADTKSQKDKNKKMKTEQLKREDSNAPSEASSLPNKTQRPSRAGGKENREVSFALDDEGTPLPEDGDAMDIIDIADAVNSAKIGNNEEKTVEEEREKLRTSGSMTQNQAEVNRVRNLTRIQMGKHEIEPWYFSPYPQEFNDVDVVYICEFCLGYFGELKQFERHRLKCTLLHPPGNEIYRDDYVSFFEIDGRRQRTWCRNLCLLSKLFLDHKTLYYDVDPFLFYCMCVRDDRGCHLVGYFSKEKESADNYNVACILTLPQHQRKGFGRLLMAFSYELSKRESKLGSPEKPLSDLGLLGYRAYWQEILLDLILQPDRTDVNIDDLAAQTAMQTNDIIHTLSFLGMLRYSKNQYVIVLPNAVVEKYNKQKEKEKAKPKHQLDADKLIWKPPVFTASSRTWNW